MDALNYIFSRSWNFIRDLCSSRLAAAFHSSMFQTTLEKNFALQAF